MTAQGWYPDPSGRFTQRWFDGNDWSDHVVGANGQTIQDPLPHSEEAAAPPPPTPSPASPGEPSPSASVPPPPPPRYPAPGPPAAPWSGGYVPRPRERFGPGLGLALDLLGLFLVALSLFALKWADVGHGGFADIHKNASHYPSGIPAADTMVKIYASYAAYLLLFLALVGAILVGVGIAARRAALQVVVAVVAGAACVYHAFVVERLFRGPSSPEIGAWLGVVGYLVLIAGLALGARRLAARAAT